MGTAEDSSLIVKELFSHEFFSTFISFSRDSLEEDCFFSSLFYESAFVH